MFDHCRLLTRALKYNSTLWNNSEHWCRNLHEIILYMSSICKSSVNCLVLIGSLLTNLQSTASWHMAYFVWNWTYSSIDLLISQLLIISWLDQAKPQSNPQDHDLVFYFSYPCHLLTMSWINYRLNINWLLCISWLSSWLVTKQNYVVHWHFCQIRLSSWFLDQSTANQPLINFSNSKFIQTITLWFQIH